MFDVYHVWNSALSLMVGEYRSLYVVNRDAFTIPMEGGAGSLPRLVVDTTGVLY